MNLCEGGRRALTSQRHLLTSQSVPRHEPSPSSLPTVPTHSLINKISKQTLFQCFGPQQYLCSFWETEWKCQGVGFGMELNLTLGFSAVWTCGLSIPMSLHAGDSSSALSRLYRSQKWLQECIISFLSWPHTRLPQKTFQTKGHWHGQEWWGHIGDCVVSQLSSSAQLTVYIPLDAPGWKLQGLIDLLQHSLQLLLLGNLWLGNLCHVELLTLQFLWGDKEKQQPLSQVTENLIHVDFFIHSLMTTFTQSLNIYSQAYDCLGFPPDNQIWRCWVSCGKWYCVCLESMQSSCMRQSSLNLFKCLI